MSRLVVIAGILIQAAGLWGQEFEVASIKPSLAEAGSSSGVTTVIGRLSAHNVTLRRCVRSAYDLPETLILGGPSWIDGDRFEIEAKAAGKAGDHDLAKMLQALLADRFKLVVHRETRPMSGYALVVAKGGAKMTPSAPDAPSRTNSRRGVMIAQACRMDSLALRLADIVHLPVADFTFLDGSFDFKLEWTPEEAQAKPDAGPSIFAALQEQLGLRLEARKIPTGVIVIDSVEKPTAN